ncbi:MAG: Calx-beta domain-containing protein [Verrucomicrobiota bacterium]
MSMPFRGMVLSLFFFAINSLSVVKAADPEPVKVAVRATDPIASEAGPTSGSFTFHRTGSTASALTVFYRVSGSATSPGDYAPLSGSVLFPAGNAAATVLVTAVDDSLAEEDETVVVTPVLAPTTGAVAPYQLESSDSATITIRDNDLGVVTLPTVSIAVEDGTAAEPSNTGRLTVARLGETKADLKVDYELVTSSIAVPADASQSSGTVTIPAAISGVDYQPLPSSFVIPAGRKSITITIQPIDDQAVEGREHVTVKLRPSAAYNINAPDQATVVISDNDPVNGPPTVEIVTPKAGDSFVAPATVPVAARVTDTDGTVRKVEFFANSKSIGVTTADNPSAGAVNPFQLSWNNVAAGEYTLTARATDDRGATADSARVRIVVNAPPRPSVSVEATQPRVLESDPTHPGVFKVTRTGSLTGKLNVSYLVSGTAGNGVDYQKLSGTVTLGAGESTALIQVVPISDKAAERSETVIVLLVQPTIVRPITALPAEENYAIASPHCHRHDL